MDEDLKAREQTLLDSFNVPHPGKSPIEVWQELASFFSFGTFRKAKSDLSGKLIITTLAPNAPFPIYARDEWIGDEWDPTDYAQNYDPDRSFFEQLVELQSKVPHPHNSCHNSIDSDWCEDSWNCNNCYLCKSMLDCEHLSYCYRIHECKQSIDLAHSFFSEQCYDCTYCYRCYRTQSSIDSRNCMDSYFLYDCRNCSNCFMSWNLRNQQYCIRNEQYSKEDYFAYIESLDLGSHQVRQELKAEFAQHMQQDALHRADHSTQTFDTTGDYNTNVKNCRNGFFLDECTDSVHLYRTLRANNSIYSFATLDDKCYMTVATGWCYDVRCCMYSSNCRYSDYLDACKECEYCFGCVGLKNKKYCILNQQYSEEDYNQLKAQIIEKMKADGEWGKFFPQAMFYVAYNESTADLYWPMGRADVLAAEFNWHDHDDEIYEGLSANELPDNITEVTDDITTTQLICPETGMKYGIAAHELEFYRQHNIPLPRKHFDQRTRERFQFVAVSQEQSGTDYFTGEPIVHYYPPEWDFEKIVSLEQYHQHVS